MVHLYQCQNKKLPLRLSDVSAKFCTTARKYYARSAEMNPLVVTENGLVCAADCLLTIEAANEVDHSGYGL
jgi:succinyl-CoA synthetase beta subunit